MFDQYRQHIKDQSHLLALFQTQKTICHQYIHIAAQQLYSQQAQILSNANELLEKIANKETVKDLSEWDVFSTRDSVVLQDQSSFSLSVLSQEPRGKYIQRKTVKGPRPSRDIEGSLNQCLRQIEDSCSSKAYATVKKVMEEYRKLKMKMFECQKKEKNMKARQKLIEDLQQKNAILTARIQDIQNKLGKLKNDNSALKANNFELNEQLLQKRCEFNSQKKIRLFEEMAQHNSTTSIRAETDSGEILNEIINGKEMVINLRYEAIKKIEQKIEKELFKNDDGCSKCCQILKRMRNSIGAYKGYLEKQGEQFERLVDNFKLKVFSDQIR